MEPIWITEAEVVELMHLGQAIDALESGLKLEAAGQAQNMVKTHVKWEGGHTLHAIGATFEGAGVFGTKTWGHTAGGATPLLIIWDSATGNLRAIIEAFALGQMRTGGISGVATKWMAAPDASDMALIGTGKQAITQVAAVAAVRDLKRIRVYSPRPESREQFAAHLRGQGFDFEVMTTDSVSSATEGASIVTAVTRAQQPFICADNLAKGTHLNAVGAITPEREEFTQDVFDRAGLIAGDNPAAVAKLSREFMTYYEAPTHDWNAVKPLCDLVAGGAGRSEDIDISLFKAMGMGISDLSLGLVVLNEALAQGKGCAIPHPQRVQPRLRAV
ncbi:ornithine cyclodeaminase family protein [Pseudomaricurvus alkylphenolicus]|uniref:ornithine cyclodeaminase family protein n=1 Tax=Pseudomaricurvus alkylphenolicus TaxID=1306991 RepID=UPI00141F3AE1|nr:ornithine cyclodeaminase family protein [Pseudomaricurvus alkylphenolicus]NIB38353.1 ornithine cyclodeaminase family protein [Pseudomaricurvus alkylphenolicus]